MIAEGINGALQFQLELPRRLGSAFDIGVVAAYILIAARHVLPDQQSQPVAPVVPAVRLDLDVLAGHVEAQPPGDLDVVAQRLVRRCGVEAVRPEPLVERSELEYELVVQEYPQHSLFIPAQGYLPHTEIALHFIDCAAVFQQCHLEVVEEG